jgi:hypothetical protein
MPGLFKKKKKPEDMERVLDELLAIRDENKEFHNDEEIDINDIIQFHIDRKDFDLFYNKKGNLRKKFRYVLKSEQNNALNKLLAESKRQKLKDEFLANGRLLHSTKKRDKQLE